jgi:tetratricopeptide (TPR) repeat protein
MAAGAADWYRGARGEIDVLSDDSSTAAGVLRRIQEARSIFAEAGIPMEHRPLRVFVFSSGAEYRRYRDEAGSQGFYHSGDEHDYIALRRGDDVGRSAFHEFVHSVLQHSGVGFPAWFEEGTADFYSNVAVTGTHLIIGNRIRTHITMLNGGWLNATKFAAVTHRSPEYSDPELARMFYAQSWALVHMLNLAPQYRGRLASFIEHVNDADAFQQAFGRTLEEALTDLRTYLPRMSPVTLDAPRVEAAPSAPTKLPAIDALLARADLAFNVDRVELARELIDKAVRVAPEAPATLAALGTLAMVENRPADARRYLERAIAQDTRNAAALFELAMLERDVGAPPQRVDELLRKVIAVNPQFGEARFLLGSHASDAGAYEIAVEHLTIAAHALARRSFVWHALGFAQWKLGRNREAAVSAYRARATAASEAEEQAAITLAEAVRP